MFPVREYAPAGGLISYAVAADIRSTELASIPDASSEARKQPICRSAAGIELTLYLKTAKALGIEFPTGLLLRADEVIE